MNDRLDHMIWIGGSPCSGKSTVAQRLVTTYGLLAYSCDDAFERHRLLITPERQPVFARLLAVRCDELWLRPVSQQIDEERELYRGGFPCILDDLLRCSDQDAQTATLTCVAEGAALLPELLAKMHVPPSRAIWIVPDELFQRTHYARREWWHDVLRACTDPEQSWENWMARDAGFARRVASDARTLGYRVILVDGAESMDEIYAGVVRHFGLDRQGRVDSGVGA